jgi:PAS domain-containing protein
MSSYTIVNLKELEDSAGERAPGIEARFARKHLNSEHLGITYIRYAADVRAPMAHSHREQEEAYIVINGYGRIRLDDEIHDLRPWGVVRIAPATVRAIEAGRDGLELIAVGSDRLEGGTASPLPAARTATKLRVLRAMAITSSAMSDGSSAESMLNSTLVEEAWASAELAMLVVDDDGHYIATNRSAEHLTGYTHHELLSLRGGRDLAGVKTPLASTRPDPREDGHLPCRFVSA